MILPLPEFTVAHTAIISGPVNDNGINSNRASGTIELPGLFPGSYPAHLEAEN